MGIDNKLDYAATLEEEFDKLGGLCFLVDVLDEDK